MAEKTIWEGLVEAAAGLGKTAETLAGSLYSVKQKLNGVDVETKEALNGRDKSATSQSLVSELFSGDSSRMWIIAGLMVLVGVIIVMRSR